MIKRIAFLQPHLEFGGAERQTVIAANRMAELGLEVHVILHEARGGLLQELDTRVIIHDLGLESHLGTPVVAVRLYRVLRDLPAAFVIVKLWSSILACALVDRILPEHTFNYCEDLDPLDHAKYIKFGKLKQRMIGWIFRRRDLVTANTSQVARSMQTFYRLTTLPPVIASTVRPEVVQKLSKCEVAEWRAKDRINIISVGTLIERKGVLRTLHALGSTGIAMRWTVLGEGPLRERLIQDAKKYQNLEINLPGGTPNPYPYMAGANLMVHNAESEAFGIVILESLVVDTPVIAASAIGPSEIQDVLGSRPELLSLVPTKNEPLLTETVKKRLADLEADGPPAEGSGVAYVSHYTLERSVQAWLDRANRLVGKQ